MLSNLLTSDLDIDLFNYCRNLGCRYTRYADDITVSGDFQVAPLIFEFRKALEGHGFKINNKKIRAKKPHQRQIVTGLVVNEKVSIKKTEQRLIRQEIFYIKTKGLEEHLRWKKLDRNNYLGHLLGKINFCLFVRPENLAMQEYKKLVISELNKIHQPNYDN